MPAVLRRVGRQTDVLAGGALLAVLIVAPFAPEVVSLFVLADLLTLIGFAAAYYLVAGDSGLLSLGHAAFFGFGAYVAALAFQRELPFFLGLGAGAVAGAVIALIIGAVSLRSTGIYFAMLTLALAQVVYLLVFRIDLFGGQDGLFGIALPPLEIGGLTVETASIEATYFVALAVVAASFAVLCALSRSSFGHLLRSAREDPVRAAALGIDVRRYQLVALVVSGGFAGLAGSLVGTLQGVVTPDILLWSQSALPLIVVLLGGIGSIWGAVIGAMGFVAIEQATAQSGSSNLWFGAVLLLLVLLFPQGLIGVGKRIGRFGGRLLPGGGRAGSEAAGREDVTPPASDPLGRAS